jgi:hypothetical protein
MSHINNELGLPIRGYYDDEISIRFLSASGKEKRQARRAERKEKREERREERKENRQQRREDRVGTQTPTGAERAAAEAWVQSNFANAVANISSLEQLETFLAVVSQNKVDLEISLGKRKSGAGRIITFGKQYKTRGSKANLCGSNECIRTTKARLDAINKFEQSYSKILDNIRKKYDPKEQSPAPPIGGDNPPPLPPSGNIATISPIDTGSGVEGGGGSDDISTGGMADKLKNVASEGVSIGGKKVPVWGIALGLIGVGAAVYFFKK